MLIHGNEVNIYPLANLQWADLPEAKLPSRGEA